MVPPACAARSSAVLLERSGSPVRCPRPSGGVVPRPQQAFPCSACCCRRVEWSWESSALPWRRSRERGGVEAVREARPARAPPHHTRGVWVGGGCEARGGRVPRRPARVPRGADSARRWRRVSVRLLRWAEPGTRGSRGRLGPGLPASLAPFVSSLACCIGREGPVARLQCHARTGRQKGEPEGPTAPGSRPPAVTAHVAGLCLIFDTVNILKECFFLPLPQTPPPSPHLHSEPS